jgi:formate hydrogenlyase subunit 3/multisubunit Na+/H+ antiporter MnhD subunit
MSLLPFLGIAFGGATFTVLLRRWPAASVVVGVIALGALFVAATSIRPDDGLDIGGEAIVGTAFGRLFLVIASGSGVLLALVAIGTSLPENLLVTLLAGLGAIGLTLSVPDPTVAVAATIAGGLIGVLVTIRRGATPAGVAVAAREMRAIAVGGALVLLATAWVSRPLGALAEDSAVFGLAYLAVATGLGMRFGAIPFHLWTARLADAAPEVALPMLTVWWPAALAIVGLAWIDNSIGPVLPVAGNLPAERAIVVAIGLACLVLGAIAAWIQDDLEHVIGYATVQDAGVVIIAVAAPDSLAMADHGAWAATRTWILVMLAARTAFAGWGAAIGARFGTRRIDDLAGWGRRSPVLAAALLGIAVASIGLPGLMSFEARATIIGLAVGGPLQTLALGAVFLPVLYYGRLLVIAFAAPGDTARAAGDDRPRPIPLPHGRSARAWSAAGRRLVEINRAAIVAVLALALSASAIAVAVGGFGVAAAAAEPAPIGPSGPGSELAPFQSGPGEGPGPATIQASPAAAP